MKQYRVRLAAGEREQLRGVLSRGTADVRTVKHTEILLKADAAAGGPGWSDEGIAAALAVGTAMVERVRRRCVTEGRRRSTPIAAASGSTRASSTARRRGT